MISGIMQDLVKSNLNFVISGIRLFLKNSKNYRIFSIKKRKLLLFLQYLQCGNILIYFP